MRGQATAGRIGGAGREAGRDRGSASLWLLAVGLLLTAVGLGGAAVGAARVARHQARAAADLGALAGAARAIDGPEVACAQAAELVRANLGRLASCTLDGLDLQITVEVSVTPLPGLTRVASATARAGPLRG
ncbi:MAG TPA: Rv3654c family TadE-like protein [Micromonosporaceae bacterium]|nr:Rv3654c family TadE-like protein [Micromonosporaceae bacterium]